MSALSALVRRRPIVSYFILTYALASLILPLLFLWLMPHLAGYFGPMVAAIIVITMTEGQAGLKKLVIAVTQWRVGLIWYVFLIALPIFATLVTVGLEILLGAPVAFKFYPAHPILILVSIIAIGEEIGWRGYALPKLLEGFSSLTASLILGFLWAGYHVPAFFTSSSPLFPVPFPAFLIWILSITVIFTWLFLRTKGSVLLATLLHASLTTFGVRNPLVEVNWWLIAGVYFMIAVLIVIAARPATFLRKLPLEIPPDIL